MRAFVFDLQRILEFRRQQSISERSRLQQLLAQLKSYEDERMSLSARNEQAWADIAGLSMVEGQDLAAFASFHGHIERQLNEVHRLKAKLIPQLEGQRLLAVEADRKVKLLERLRDQKHREWIAGRDKEIDELSADSHVARLSALRRARRLRC